MGRGPLGFATLVASVLVVWSGAALAYDKEATTAPGWRFELQPYGFVPMVISGDATVADQEVPIDVTVGDLFEKLEFAAMLRFEAWNGPWGVVVNGVYSRLANTKSLGPIDFDLKSRTTVGEALGGYRLGSWACGYRESTFAADLFAGVQVAWLSETLDIEARSLSDDATFVKGIFGARGIFRLSPSWAFGARVFTGAPNVFVSVGGGVEWDLSRYAIKLGYVYDQYHYSATHVKVDVSAHGPYLGFGIRFGSGPIY